MVFKGKSKWTALFICQFSFPLTRKLKVSVRLVYRVPFKLSKRFIRLGQDALSKSCRKHVVYKIDCMQCNQIYIGQTKRPLSTRTQGHKCYIRLQTKYHKVITKHSLNVSHTFDFDNVEILHTENHLKKRLFSECMYIKKHLDNTVKDLDNYVESYDSIIDFVI